MSSLAIAALVFVAVFSCALLGLFLRTRLPEHHLSPDSRDGIKLAMGLIGTMAALVLGLLTASAKSAYDIENDAVLQSAANVIVLDRVLAHYGPETKEIRARIRQAITFRLELTWPESNSAPGKLDAPAGTSATESIEDAIRALAPQNDTQRELRAKALQLTDGLLRSRWLVFARASSSLPMIFLVVLVFWLGILFGGFGLLAPRNATVFAVFAVCAVAVSGSIFLILEMNEPFAGLMKISGAPVRYALTQIGQ